MAFLDQLAFVHLGGRSDPQLDRNVALGAEQLGRCAEMADVGHAGTDEGFVDLGASDFRQRLGIVRIVGAAQDGFLDVGEIDLDDVCVFGVLVGFEQAGVGQPGFDLFDAALQGACVGVAVGDHVLHQHDVAGEVFLDRLGVELDGATGGGALGGRVGELKRLLNLEIRQAFDLQDATRKLVDLARLGHGEQTLLDGVQRNRVHQIAQRHAGLHLALEAHQHRLGHVQRHHTGGSAESHQAGTRWETDADGGTRVAVTARAYGVGQQQAVEPRVDHAVTWTQRHTTAAADELGQLAVRLHIDRLGVSRRVAERLHHQVGREAQASQVLQLVACHRAGGVL